MNDDASTHHNERLSHIVIFNRLDDEIFSGFRRLSFYSYVFCIQKLWMRPQTNIVSRKRLAKALTHVCVCVFWLATDVGEVCCVMCVLNTVIDFFHTRKDERIKLFIKKKQYFCSKTVTLNTCQTKVFKAQEKKTWNYLFELLVWSRTQFTQQIDTYHPLSAQCQLYSVLFILLCRYQQPRQETHAVHMWHRRNPKG